jgi:hypothetical protein
MKFLIFSTVIIFMGVSNAQHITDINSVVKETGTLKSPECDCSCQGPYRLYAVTHTSKDDLSKCFYSQMLNYKTTDFNEAKKKALKLFKSNQPFYYSLNTDNDFCSKKFSNPTNLKIHNVRVVGTEMCTAFELDTSNPLDLFFY